MKYYTVYQITNLLDGKIYIGAHLTEKLDDGYMGSGTRILNAIRKHGEEHFNKEILYVLSSEEEMYEKEAELVNEEFVANTNTYNLRIGGIGGFSGTHTDETLWKIKETKMKNGTWCKPHSVETRIKIKEAARRHGKSGQHWVGKNHTDKTKKKMSKSKKGQFVGEKNGQFGTCWMYNDEKEENKKIDQEFYLSKGWKCGVRMIYHKNSPQIHKHLKNAEIKRSREEKKAANNVANKAIREEKKNERLRLKKYNKWVREQHRKWVREQFEMFRSGEYCSVREFHRSIDCSITIQALARNFVKHIPEYKIILEEKKAFRDRNLRLF